MIGILSAMPQEAGLLARELKREAEHVHGGRTYCTGTLAGRRVVVVFSRIGKVAAAATAQHLIDVHRVQSIVFSGVAGALDPTLSVGDIIVGRRLWQHDMDASPIFPALEVPLLGVSAFAADARELPADSVCSADFRIECIAVTLAAPLGERAVWQRVGGVLQAFALPAPETQQGAVGRCPELAPGGSVVA